MNRLQLLERGGALIVAFSTTGGVAFAADTAPAPRSVRPDRVDSWLAIARDGRVTVYTGKVDAGVGLRTSFAQIVADELDVAFDRVEVIVADTATTPDQGKSTASTGVSVAVQPLRVAANTARRALIAAAATRLGAGIDELATGEGAVWVRAMPAHRVAYGDLIDANTLALDLKVARESSYGPELAVTAPLRSYIERRAVGQSFRRSDMPAKVTGSYEHVHNVRIPGMLHGRVVRPPAIGAKLLTVDESSVAHIPSVRIVRRADFLGVVAQREEHAIQAAASLAATWSAGTQLLDPQALYAGLKALPVAGQSDTLKVGDVDAALAGATRRFTGSYGYPYQLHGMLGPSCAVADVRDGGATIWSGTQWPNGTRDDVAKMLGLARDRVQVVWREASGSYGRLGCDDAAADAAVLSAAVGRPVRVQWMRPDEHGWEPISPAVAMDVEAALDANGNVAAFSLVHHAQSTAVAESGATVAWQLLGTAPGSKRLAGFPEDASYAIPALRFRAIHVTGPYRTLFMRAPGILQSAFAIESAMDELAELAGVDPVSYRLRQMTNARDRDVLQSAVALAAWDGRPSPQRGGRDALLTGRGISHIRWSAGGARACAIAQVTVERSSGNVRVERLAIALDCGLMINPDGVLNQVQGCALQGLSRALHEEVRFDAHGVASRDWRSYPILRFSDVPELQVALRNRTDVAPTGVGEAGGVPVAAAVANAIYDATGKRIRRPPFTPDNIRPLLG